MGSIAVNQRVPQILYEDNHLLVVVKPVNLPVQADDSGDPDLLSLLKADLKVRYLKPGNVYLGLVHRLDRPVGGVMVFAKTSKAAARLSEQIRNRDFNKVYLAIIQGVPAHSMAKLRHYLRKDHFTNVVTVLTEQQPEAKEAILEYEVVSQKEPLCLVKVKLETGRSHQIRAQLAFIGHPIYGDQKYGRGLTVPGQQLALWSVTVCFEHPTRNEKMQFTANPPLIHPWNMFQ